MQFSRLTATLALFFPLALLAQNPVTWKFASQDLGNCQADITFTASIQDGWFTYSQFLETTDGPVPTSFKFEEGAHFKLVDKVKEGGEKITVHDPVFDMKLSKFKHQGIFTQRVEIIDPLKPIVGQVEFMVCNDEMCLPPKTVNFTITPSVANCAGSSGPRQ
jgi:hypothetical protein